jgi:hypothetical protein
VAFATLQVGSNNHLPNRRFRGDGKEFSARNAAVLGWLRQTFRLARERGSTGVMLAMQGDPWYESPDQRTGYHDLLRAMEEEVGRFRRPVLLVHGDTHSYRLDQPLVDSRTGRPLPNFTRVETFGPHDLAWVRVTVDPGRPGIFRIRPERVESHPRP